MFRTISVIASIALLSIFPACKVDSKGGGFEEDKTPAQPGVHVKPKKDPDAPPDFGSAMKFMPKYDAATKTVSVEVSLKDGFHAYAAGTENGVPMDLGVKELNGWKASGEAKVPPGVKKDFGDLGVSNYLEGTFALSIGAEGGAGDLAGELAAQICTEKACDRPRKHEFQLAIK